MNMLRIYIEQSILLIFLLIKYFEMGMGAVFDPWRLAEPVVELNEGTKKN
jgi:hypothetical protein